MFSQAIHFMSLFFNKHFDGHLYMYHNSRNKMPYLKKKKNNKTSRMFNFNKTRSKLCPSLGQKIGLFMVPWPKKIESVGRKKILFFIQLFYFEKHNFSVEKSNHCRHTLYSILNTQ